ncbi:LysR substrate-binding domain-containing protein [Shewanella submarina]|uniref:LysR substrate-binding domain-containing protein n=1 Tax=Shewanella submarina TaxID=2016376 RepID=A0ABV7G8X8_9GAMM|nr:LysR substrate-binding domain-containing protein [Shewanella submarina]MCL1038497.1 LysR substrate-binding domain-containing protein [Shewanella submarina]
MKLPPLKSLLYFKHVAQSGSLKTAAQQLYVTQAAVSQQIKSLEQHLGCQLFLRKVRQIELTPEGKQLLPYVVSGIGSLEQGVASFQQDPRPNVLNLSVLSSFAHCWLMPRLSDFQKHHPDIKIRLEPSDSLVQFDIGDTDLGIRFGYGDYPNLNSECLSGDSILLACKPGTIDTSKPLREQLIRQKLIMDVCPDAERAWQALFDHHEIAQQDIPEFLSIDNAALVVQATQAGQGIAMLRRQLIAPLIELGQLEQITDFEITCQFRYFLVAPESHFRWPKVEHFRRWLMEQMSTNVS